MSFLRKIQNSLSSMIPESARHDADTLRRCHLIISFAIIGIVFGLSYSTAYFIIGYTAGAWVILFVVAAIGLTPRLMRYPNPALVVGNFYALIVTVMLIAVTSMEGGIPSGSPAWFTAVPLIALLIAGRRSALVWGMTCMLIIAAVGFAQVEGTAIPIKYNPHWYIQITSASDIGLLLFVLALAFILERGRESTYLQLQAAASALASANQRLTRMNEEKNEFLAIAAHDLRNPLTSVVGTTELITLTNKSTNPEIDRQASMILRSAVRMRDIIGDLLDVYAFEQENIVLRREVIDLNALIAELLPPHEAEGSTKNIRLQLEPCSDPAFIEGDPRALSDIADNLISNAVKYSPHGKEIHIRLRSARDAVHLEVQDEGPGIPESDRTRLFHKFARLSARPTGGESSHGLGLSIVKKYTEAMGGEITCAPYTGGGAHFIVAFPPATKSSAPATR